MKKKFDFHLSYEEKEKRKKALDSKTKGIDFEAIRNSVPADTELIKYKIKISNSKIILKAIPTKIAIDSEKDYDNKLITALNKWLRSIKRFFHKVYHENINVELENDWYSGQEWFNGLELVLDLEDWIDFLKDEDLEKLKALDAVSNFDDIENEFLETWNEDEKKRYQQNETVQELLEGIMNTRDSELARDLTERMTDAQVLELIDLLRRVKGVL